MKTVLLTGGLGYIGSHLYVQLMETKQYNVVLFDNLLNSKINVLYKLQQITEMNQPIQFVKGDVCNREDVISLFLKYSFDIVIHLAGLKSVSESIQYPEKYYSQNIVGLTNLLEIMKSFSVHHLIFSSSATVYGIQNHRCNGFKEEDVVNFQTLTNPYAKTKYLNEMIVQDFIQSNPEFKCVILRYFNPIGCHPSGFIGENPNNIPNNLFPYLLKVAKKELSELKIFGNDYSTSDGTPERDFIHVSDLAESHIASIRCFFDSKFKNQNLWIYNVGTGVPISVKTLVETFQKVNQIDIPHTYVERRQGDIDSCFANTSKIEKELGWRAKNTLEDCCRDGYEFIFS